MSLTCGKLSWTIGANSNCFSTLFRVRSVAWVNKYEHAVPKIGTPSCASIISKEQSVQSSRRKSLHHSSDSARSSAVSDSGMQRFPPWTPPSLAIFFGRCLGVRRWPAAGVFDNLKQLLKSDQKRTGNEVHKTCRKCSKFSTLGLARNAFSHGRVVKNH